jgi:hypothetical protein
VAGLLASDREWRQTCCVAERLEELEERVRHLLTSYDASPFTPAPLDELLTAAFRYAYLRGLAEARYGEPTWRRTCGRLLRRMLIPAIAGFAHRMDRVGLPVPRHEVRILLRDAA